MLIISIKMALSKESQNRVISAIDEAIFYTFALQPWLLTTWDQSLGNLGSLRIGRKGLEVRKHETKYERYQPQMNIWEESDVKEKMESSMRWQRWPPASGWCGQIWSPGASVVSSEGCEYTARSGGACAKHHGATGLDHEDQEHTASEMNHK